MTWRKRQVLKMAEQASLSRQDWWKDDEALERFAEQVREEALAQQEQPAQQEPVAVHQFRKRGCSDWYDGNPDHTDGCGPYEARTLYTSTPARHGWTTQQIAGMARLKEAQDKKLSQRTWVGLTDWEISQLWISTSPYFNEDDFARAIEAKLKEKNT